MLLPFEFVILTLEDAQKLVNYIETSTATVTNLKNTNKMIKLGVYDIYMKLEEFVRQSKHYKDNLCWFLPDDYLRKDENN